MKMFIQLLFLVILGIQSSQQQSNSTSPSLSKFNQIYDKNEIQIGYQIIDSYLYMNVSCINNGWIGLGYGNGMTNVDMTIISLKNNAISVDDYWGFKAGNIQADVELNGTNNVQIVDANNTFDSQSGKWQIIFKRPLAQMDKLYDSEIIINESTKFSIALGDSLQFSTSKQHQFAEAFDVTYQLSSNQTISTVQLEDKQNSALLNCYVLFTFALTLLMYL